LEIKIKKIVKASYQALKIGYFYRSMEQGRIIKYTASAGSGKTHTLTGEYLLRLFANPNAYRRILAVTFTNKAAAGMKSRILDELSAMAEGKHTSQMKRIAGELNMPPVKIRTLAADILSSILSDYSRFSVGTIDSFFQKIFRSFTREIGLQTNFSIQLDYSIILHEAIDDLLNELNNDEELRRWLVRYAAGLFDEGKRIDLAGSIFKLSGTIFSEQFKLLPDELRSKLSDLGNIRDFVSEMEEYISRFRTELRKLGEEGVRILDENGVDDDLLRGGKNGIGRYLRITASGEIREPYKVIANTLEDDKWHSSSKCSAQVTAALANGLRETVSAISEMMQNRYPGYLTARLILRNIYVAAILTDVMKMLRRHTTADNSFLLADTGDLLLKVTGNDQTPFIYEKTGNEYDVFMIDEFQDTSMIQYLNFRPLIENSLAQGSDALVVGDIKQSIYRWRNGEWTILGRLLENDFGRERVEPRLLDTNWRSREAVVNFNNSLFSMLPGILDNSLAVPVKSHENITPYQPFLLSEIYRDVIQQVPGGRDGGYVRICFVEGDDETDRDTKVLRELPGIIMQCQDDGYQASDIGILVRRKEEGIMILEYLNAFRQSMAAGETRNYNFNILSGESLLVGSSPAVRFIMALMIRLTDAGNMLNRSEMLRYYLLAVRPGEIRNTDISLSNIDQSEERVYPTGYRDFLARAGSKPLFTLSEEAILFFGLNEAAADIASLDFFQDQVLDFMNRRGSGLRAFTEWWLDQGAGSSVNLSGEQDSISIMTIHKAKGLQFKVVIVPFITWGFDQMNSNLLWVTPPAKPFSKAGAFPLGYQQDLVPTLFSRDYFTERCSSYLDNLNIMYVAFTRSEERLYGFSYAGTQKDAGTILKSAFQSCITCGEGLITLSSFFNADTGIFEYGNKEGSRIRREAGTLIPAQYPVYDGQTRLNLRLYGRDLLKEDTGDMKPRVRYGMVLHEILGRVRCRSDIHDAIESAVMSGFISRQAYEATERLIESMVTKPEAAGWFAEDATIMTEPEILTGSGDIRRPDRVVIRDGRATIVDYKFGKERPEHRRQMDNYRNLMEEMGYHVEAAYLWYVEYDRIVRL
jgi:ATP-dependent exoDNAse (exonuclease V) beta subunit